jgi:hypothetical protein
VVKWRRQYAESGLTGLEDAPRPGGPRRVLTDEVVCQILAATVTPPESLRGGRADTLVELADWLNQARGISVSHDSIVVLWRGFCLQPHRTEGFKFSTDLQLDAKVRDVAGLHLEPPQNAIVVCVDEKPQIQALDRTRPSMRPGISPSGTRTATSGTAPPPCSPPWKWPTAHSCGPSSGHVTYTAGKTRPPTFPCVSGTRSFDVAYMCSCDRTCARYVRGDVW